MVCVADEHGRQRRHQARRSVDENFANDPVDLVEPLARNHVRALAQVRGAEARQGVVEVRVGGALVVYEVRDPDVEQLEKNQKLLGGEGPAAALDLAEPTLRQPEASRELALPPAALFSEIADLCRDRTPVFIQ